MNKLSIDKLDLKNKRVLVRVDFNVPLDEKLNVTNDIRIVESLPTIKKIIESGGKAILMSHLGRPKGERKTEFSLKPAAERLSKLIGKEVKLAPDCIGAETEKMVNEMKPGDVVLLERFLCGLQTGMVSDGRDPGNGEEVRRRAQGAHRRG